MGYSPLEQSVLKTLAYFDLADFPLTREELFSYLWQPPRLGYAEFLEWLSATRIMEQKYGYYFLPGRGEIVEARRRALLMSELKMKVARRAAKKIRSVPFLKAIFVCNSVGTEQSRAEGDIDFFIVTAPGRIWLVRFFTNVILRFWRLRVHGEKKKNRVCLTFYADDQHLDLSGRRALEEDVHFAYWLCQMAPLYDPGNYYQKFLSANGWTDKYLPLLNRPALSSFIAPVENSGLGKLWKRAWEAMWKGAYGSLVESQIKQILLGRMKKSLKEMAARGDNSVVISDTVLKFHENDRRRGYHENWKQRLLILNI